MKMMLWLTITLHLWPSTLNFMPVGFIDLIHNKFYFFRYFLRTRLKRFSLNSFVGLTSFYSKTYCSDLLLRLSLLVVMFVFAIIATTSCKSTWVTVPYFGINGLSMILCLWFPLHPLSKLLAIQDHTQNWRNNFEWEGGVMPLLYLTDLWPGAIWSKKGHFLEVSQHFCNWL